MLKRPICYTVFFQEEKIFVFSELYTEGFIGNCKREIANEMYTLYAT